MSDFSRRSWRRAAAWLYHLWAQLARVRGRPIPPAIPCQYCGGNHPERYCPNLVKLGFIEPESKEDRP